MIAAGVIDPLKVVRTALVDAASVSSLMMTSECMIVEGKPRSRHAGRGRHGTPRRHGWHGSMGGMGF